MSAGAIASLPTPFSFGKSKDRLTHELQYGDGSTQFGQASSVLAMRITRPAEGGGETFFRMLRVDSIAALDSSNTGMFRVKFLDMDDELLLEVTTNAAAVKFYAVVTSLAEPFCVRFQSLQAATEPSPDGPEQPARSVIDISMTELWYDPALAAKFSPSMLSARDLLQHLHGFIVNDVVLPTSAVAKQLVEDQNVSKLRIRASGMPPQPTSMLLVFSAKATSSSALLSSNFLDLYTDTDLRALKRAGSSYPLMDKLRAEIFAVYGVPEAMQAALAGAVDSYIHQAAAARVEGMGASDQLADYVPDAASAQLSAAGDSSPAMASLAALKQSSWAMADEMRQSNVDILQSFEKNDLRQRLDALINQNQRLELALDAIKRGMRRTYLKYVAYNLGILGVAALSTVVCFLFGPGPTTRALAVVLMMVFLISFAVLVVLGTTVGV